MVYVWDFWSATAHEPVELSCLMPNSCFIPLTVQRDTKLREVKEELWLRATELPLSDRLHPKSCYAFQFVNSLAATEEVTDESIRLCDLKPAWGVLKFVETRAGDDNIKIQNAQISHLIGRDLKYFDTLESVEVNAFRAKMRHLAGHQAERKKNQTWLQRLLERFPTRLAESPELPTWLSQRLRSKNDIQVNIKFEQTDESITLTVLQTASPQKLVRLAFMKIALSQRTFQFESWEKFVLKVCGQQEYILGSHPLIQFTYIQEMLAEDKTPDIIVMSIDKPANDLLNPSAELTTVPIFTGKMPLKKENVVPSYKIEDNFSCSVLAVCKLNVDVTKSTDVMVRAGLYHGGKQLCEHRTTCVAPVAKAGVARWADELGFSIKISDIPNMARLCFVVIEKSGFKKCQKSLEEYKLEPRAWVNVPVFDYDGRMKEGTVSLHTWPYLDEHGNEALLLPLGTVARNSSKEHCITMTVDFRKYSSGKPIEYADDPDYTVSIAMKDSFDLDEHNFEKQIRVMEQNPFYEIHEQDSKDLWALRSSLPRLAPKLLPKLLQATDWGKREDVMCVHQLLLVWPALPVEISLELLDYAYPDPSVRTFAINCLQHISDEQISLYLLQLVQALKHESYLLCDLAVFLLNRAFANAIIGHFLFWHLRSEIESASVAVRFQLMLEAYCRGCHYQLPVLVQQVNCFEKLVKISQTVRQIKDLDSARSTLRRRLDELRFTETTTEFTSTVNPRYHCKYIRPSKCRVMDSKMRPLLLTFENTDAYGEDISIILKNGDDLRQDMFTLQMLRIMDILWKNAGYDFRLNVYRCVAMGDRVGMIEVVPDAQTIANIQKEKGNLSPLLEGWLQSWLKRNNEDEGILERSVSEFMWSCAGYCVATYILGVGDRHSDNIMIKRCGQLFHIDFGHILGNYKAKFGIRRERVPFVLAHEFVNVISRGHKQDSKEFCKFRQLCEDAFFILRRNGALIVSLFTTMISTGLPELSSEKDLHYLKETLALGCSEEEAKTRFHAKFDKALSNDWKTSINWLVHNISKNNY